LVDFFLKRSVDVPEVRYFLVVGKCFQTEKVGLLHCKHALMMCAGRVEQREALFHQHVCNKYRKNQANSYSYSLLFPPTSAKSLAERLTYVCRYQLK